MSKSINVKRMCYLALFCAIAIILSYIETLIPFHLSIPGTKIGLANITTIIMLFCFGYKEAFFVMLLRIFIVGITFTNLYMMLYSLAGGILSLAMMALFYQTKLFSNYTISIIGGIFHNIGQLLIAMFFFNTSTFLYYLPYLLLIGTITGTVIGIISQIIYIKTGNYIIKQK